MIVQRVVISRIAVDAPHVRGSDFRLESLLPDVLLGDLNGRGRECPRCGLRQIDRQLGGLAMAANLPDESRRMIARGLARRVDIGVHALNEARLLGTEVDRDWLEQTEPGYSEDLLTLANKAGLLDITHRGRIRFAHHILQEYFAALELMERIGEPMSTGFERFFNFRRWTEHLSEQQTQALGHLTDPWWTETLTLF